jgi:hypothetical protein
MTKFTRRNFLQTSASGITSFSFSQTTGTPKSLASDILISALSFEYEEHLYRAPYKFGGVPVDRATLINVTVTVKTRSGKTAKGFGSMPLGNVWSFPSREMPYATTLGAMKSLAERIAKITRGYNEYSHPIEINFALEPEYLKAAAEVSKELKLAAPIPKLCALVTASAFDAAIHDAFGKLHGRNCYQTYGRDLMTHDLSRYLNKDFKGEFPAQYILTKPKPRVSMFHSVGGADAVLSSELSQRINDGMPETLAEWIKFNGLTHIKIKLQGEDLKWDIERTVNIDRIASETRPNYELAILRGFQRTLP